MDRSDTLESYARNRPYAPFATILDPLAAIGAAIARKFDALHRGIAFRRTVSALPSLDDRTLRDIGLSRTDIVTAAREACEN